MGGWGQLEDRTRELALRAKECSELRQVAPHNAPVHPAPQPVSRNGPPALRAAFLAGRGDGRGLPLLAHPGAALAEGK